LRTKRHAAFAAVVKSRARVKRGSQLAFEGWREAGLFDDHESAR
jgi:hypothetical protein